MDIRHLHRVVLLAAAVVPLVSALASAQYRIDNSSARDANNRLGSGGYNDATSGNRIGGLAGNYIVTGNVTNGRSFRGALGYTDPSSFRGNLGSGAFDNFVRDSTGVGQLRGDYSRPNFSSTVQPYFGSGQTVAPPAGFTRSPAFNGAYIPRAPTTVEPNDGRIDYGGATAQQVTQSYLGDQRFIGGAGLATTSGQQWSEATPQTRPLQLSEFTQLARQSRTSVFGGALTAANATPSDPTLTSLNNGANGSMPNGLNSTGTSPSSNGNGTERAALPDQRLNADVSPANVDDAKQKDNRLDGTGVLTPGRKPDEAPDADPRNAGSTGQISTIRNLRAVENNQQYAELRSRLSVARKPRQLPGAAANAQIQEVNSQLIKQRESADGAANNKKPAAPGQRLDARAGQDAAKVGEGTSITSTGVAGGTTPAKPVDPNTAGEAEPTRDDQLEKAVPQDTLQLPRPAGDAAAIPATQPSRMATPLQIRSFADGVKDKNLVQTLREAEDLMKAGKFGSAIESYDHAGELANDDPLVFMGRSIAELGGSYYRKSELHLRQAFAGDPALLGAKFDLRGLLTDARLNFLTNDLGEVARTNPNDPGPILLLAFIYYNGNMQDRATRALDIAQQRAGGNDPVIKLLKENWQLAVDAEPSK